MKKDTDLSWKLTATVESHTACPSEIMPLETPLLDELLSGDITGSKEDGSSDALGQ